MVSKAMIFRKAWVFKVISLVMGHLQFFHYSAGTFVLRDCEGNDFGQLKLSKANLKGFACRFRGVTKAPNITTQTQGKQSGWYQTWRTCPAPPVVAPVLENKSHHHHLVCHPCWRLFLR